MLLKKSRKNDKGKKGKAGTATSSSCINLCINDAQPGPSRYVSDSEISDDYDESDRVRNVKSAAYAKSATSLFSL